MKIFVITGEPSGDLHASKVVSELLKIDSNIQVRGWGGDLLLSAGMQISTHINSITVMGFSDVIKRLPELFRRMKQCQEEIKIFNPDLLFLVDYSGFNLRMAQWASKNGYKVHYYIAPKTWAWRSSRDKMLKKNVDQLYCIFPFEEEYFRNADVKATYVGNPTASMNPKDSEGGQQSVAILPGSRKQEIKRILPKFNQLIKDNPDVTWVISKMSNLSESYYESILPISSYSNVTLSEEGIASIRSRSYAAFIASGTASLEATMLNWPHAVVYHTSRLNYHLGKAFIKTEYISLPNILAEGEVVKELIQNDFNDSSLKSTLKDFNDEEKMKTMKENFEQIKGILGNKKPELIIANHILDSYHRGLKA